MNIFLLTSVYPSEYSPKGTTQVVHYFTKEWAAAGNEVRVFHTSTCFPSVYYYLGRPFKKILDSKLGHLMPVQSPKEYEEEKDGVKISHINLKKLMPHGRFSKKQINRAFQIVETYVEKEGVPE